MSPKLAKPLRILLADDDRDDRYFFGQALQELAIPAKLSTVEDGEKLISYLYKHMTKMPDVLFLDLNMPRKNGAECLSEIKACKKLQSLPVVIYSTSLHDDVADVLYANGAHYYLRKCDFSELKKTLKPILTRMAEKRFERPRRDHFCISLATT
jgi:CheY-like chemotaxis protein